MQSYLHCILEEEEERGEGEEGWGLGAKVNVWREIDI